MPINNVLAEAKEKLAERAERGIAKSRNSRKGKPKPTQKDGEGFLKEPPKPTIQGARVVQGWRNKNAED